jgi:cytochrome P450 PksS
VTSIASPAAGPKFGSRAFKADPFPFYARLRADAPVSPITLPDGQRAWLVTRYADVAACLKDPRLAKDRHNAPADGSIRKEPWVPEFVRPLERNMLDLDDPHHARLRGLVHKAFTPATVERLRAGIQRTADQLVDRMEHARAADLIAAFALPLPLAVIVDLLGVPAADRARFHRWSKAIVRPPTPLNVARALPSLIAFMRYLRRLLRRLREDPQDGLLSALVQVEQSDDRLSEDELLAMAFLLLVAGHETTVNLIASGTLALLQHPDQMERLRADGDLMKSAVEELLRFTNPLETATERYARQELVIADTTIPQGSLVLAVLASANRDDAQFAAPNALDIARADNRHLAFGLGPHFCLGAPLARLEGQIALGTLLRRLPDLRLRSDASALRWRTTPTLRGLEALPVRYRRPS